MNTAISELASFLRCSVFSKELILTDATALSRVDVAPPPRDIDATVGAPVAECCWATKFNPDTLEYFQHKIT